MNTNEIIEKADDIVLEQDAMEGESDAGTTFCTAWPAAKQGLDLLKNLIKNPIAKLTIAGAIAAGDAVASKLCK